MDVNKELWTAGRAPNQARFWLDWVEKPSPASDSILGYRCTLSADETHAFGDSPLALDCFLVTIIKFDASDFPLSKNAGEGACAPQFF